MLLRFRRCGGEDSPSCSLSLQAYTPSRWFIRVVVVYSSEIAHGYLEAPRKNAGDEMLPLKNCWVQAMIGKRLLLCGSTELLFYVTTGQSLLPPLYNPLLLFAIAFARLIYYLLI